MLLDLISDLMYDISPFYLYISIIISVITTLKIFKINMHYVSQQNIGLHRDIITNIQSLPSIEIIGEILRSQTLLTKTVKRLEAPEDDTDDYHFSFYLIYRIKRGGRRWNKNLYSLFLRNINGLV